MLAGLKGPQEAAQAAGVSVPRYYAAEARALQGLLKGCEPVTPGRQPGGTAELQKAQKECQRLKRQCDRQQALLRLQQRALGLSASPAPARAADKKNGGKKRRRPRQRTLRLIDQLRQEALQAALDGLTPRPVGRPATPPPDPRVAELEREKEALRLELLAAQTREEIALVLPRLAQAADAPQGDDEGKKARRRRQQGRRP